MAGTFGFELSMCSCISILLALCLCQVSVSCLVLVSCPFTTHSTFEIQSLVDVAGFRQQEAHETWQLLELLPPNTSAELLAALLD